MRVAPTMTLITAANTNVTSPTLTANLNMFELSGTATAAGAYTLNEIFSAVAEIQ
jgi:hypothetical protein